MAEPLGNGSGQPTKVKIVKEEWQKQVLLRFYGEGMTGTGKAFEHLLLQATDESQLPLQTVKDWVLNQGRPNRYKKASRPPSNVYQLFMKEYKPKTNDLSFGVLAKERGEDYQSCLKSEGGRAALEKKLEEYQQQASPELTKIQQENAIKKQLDKIESCCDALGKLGVVATLLYARPGWEVPGVVGATTGVRFFVNRKSVAQEFARVVLDQVQDDVPKARPGDNEAVLRGKVQDVLNESYRKLTGDKSFPYRSTLAGKTNVELVNLPVPLKKPSSYNCEEMRKILDAADKIYCQRKETTRPDIDEGTLPAAHSDMEIEVTIDGSSGQQIDTITQDPIAQPETSYAKINQSHEEDAGIVVSEEGGAIEIQIYQEEMETSSSQNLTELKTFQSTKEAIKNLEDEARKTSQFSKGRRTLRKTVDSFNVERMWTMDDDTKRWYKGKAVELSNGTLDIIWEDGIPGRMTKREVAKEIKEKTFRFI